MDFIKRIHRYSCKHSKNGSARIYIQNTHVLKQSGFHSGDTCSYEFAQFSIDISLTKNGSNTVQATQRGELIELKSKSVAKSFPNVNSVIITFRLGRIRISISHADAARIRRELSLKSAVKDDRPITFGSLYSGLGLLAYQLIKGMSSVGVDSLMGISSDICELTLSCQLESNPIWDNPHPNAIAIADDITALQYHDLPEVDVLEIGYPCWGQSTLSPKHRRDLDHPVVGAKFIPTVASIVKLNPALIIFENSVPFLTSKTLDLMKRELENYNFFETTISGHDYGDFEQRKRSCVIAVSAGLPLFDLNLIKPSCDSNNKNTRTLSSLLSDVPDNSTLWKDMDHVTNKISDKRLNFKHNLYCGEESEIAALSATYLSPKISSPMVLNENTGKQRLFTPEEHARIREVPKTIFQCLQKVADGRHPLVSKRGSMSAVHKMLGNGPAPKAWFNAGKGIGEYLKHSI